MSIEERIERLESLLRQLLQVLEWSREEEGYDWIKREIVAMQKELP